MLKSALCCAANTLIFDVVGVFCYRCIGAVRFVCSRTINASIWFWSAAPLILWWQQMIVSKIIIHSVCVSRRFWCCIVKGVVYKCFDGGAVSVSHCVLDYGLPVLECTVDFEQTNRRIFRNIAIVNAHTPIMLRNIYVAEPVLTTLQNNFATLSIACFFFGLFYYSTNAKQISKDNRIRSHVYHASLMFFVMKCQQRPPRSQHTILRNFVCVKQKKKQSQRHSSAQPETSEYTHRWLQCTKVSRKFYPKKFIWTE